MTDHHDHNALTYKTYFFTWFLLLVLTAIALGVGSLNIDERLKAFLLVGTTLAKILVIAAMFMHLRYERKNLILITFAPLILAVIMFAFTYPETLGNPTHLLEVRPESAKEAPKAVPEHK